MSTPYVALTDVALAKLREWAEGKDLPDDPWKLPKDCPIWKMGLTDFQAQFVLRRLRRERASA